MLQNFDDRAERLVEFGALRPSEDFICLAGTAGEFLLASIEATWVYGFFPATVLTSHAFCRLQLAGLIRQLPEDADLPQEGGSLEELANIASTRRVIGVDVEAQLVSLHDRASDYAVAGLQEFNRNLDRHIREVEAATDNAALQIDARAAIRCVWELLVPKR
jgi:hypothetical protein